MKTHFIFNPARAWQLLSNDFKANYKRMLIGVGAILGILSLLGLLMGADIPDKTNVIFKIHYTIFPFAFVIIGLILTSFAFREMSNPHERHFYLSLPASNLEKFTVRWLETVILYPIFFILLYYVFSLIFDAISIQYLGITNESFNPISINVYVFFRVFLVAQSIYFLGAIFFNKYTLLKTAFSTFGLSILSTLIVMVLFRIIFNSFFGEGIFSEPTVEANISDSFQNFMGNTLVPWGETLVYGVLPLFMWFVSYLKLTEKEL